MQGDGYLGQRTQHNEEMASSEKPSPEQWTHKVSCFGFVFRTASSEGLGVAATRLQVPERKGELLSFLHLVLKGKHQLVACMCKGPGAPFPSCADTSGICRQVMAGGMVQACGLPHWAPGSQTIGEAAGEGGGERDLGRNPHTNVYQTLRGTTGAEHSGIGGRRMRRTGQGGGGRERPVLQYRGRKDLLLCLQDLLLLLNDSSTCFALPLPCPPPSEAAL
jgi:hypothetical protein